MGLSTVHGIVEQHGGHIRVHSAPHKGTQFNVYLPEAPKAETDREIEAGVPPAATEEATVLVVEDDASVRKLAYTILNRNGYDVMESEEPEHALTLAETHKGPIHLLLTDVVMPNIRGPQLFERIHALHPETKVLYMTGYPRQSISGDELLPEAAQILQKPFMVTTLLEKVAECLFRKS